MELSLEMQPPQRNWAKICAQVACMLATLISPGPSEVLVSTPLDHIANTSLPAKTPLQFFHYPKIKVAIPDTVSTLAAYKKKLANRVSAYGTIEELDIYIQLVNKFPTLWKDDGFIHVIPKEWMRIPLKEGWESKIIRRSKIYPLDLEDRKLVDKTLNEMHEKSRLKWTNVQTPFSYPVLVVWRAINGVRKG